MSKALKNNYSLQDIKFQEDGEKKWNDSSKAMFIEMLRSHKNPTFKKIKFDPADKKDTTKGHKQFKEEMKFFIKKIKSQHKAADEFDERFESCANENMFNNLLELIENPDDHEKMPVRKFFNNTFGTLLNDAIF